MGARPSFLGKVVAGVALAVAAVAPVGAAARIDHEAACTYKQLDWDDFRGPEERGQQVAWVVSTIVMESPAVEIEDGEGEEVVARIDYPIVYALMDKLKSGVARGGKSEETLAHEQLHFDITELYARRLHHRLLELESRGSEGDLALRRQLQQQARGEYQKAMQELLAAQARYDGESRHGHAKKEQKRWAREVAEQLAALEAYPLL